MLVLLVVPALLAVQQDIARHVTAFRRSLSAPEPVLKTGTTVLLAALLAWGGVTLGWTLVRDALPTALAGISPVDDPVLAAILLFLAGATVLTALGFALLAVVLRVRRPAGV